MVSKTFICTELSLRLNSSVRILWSSSLQTGFMFQAKRDGLTYIFTSFCASISLQAEIEAYFLTCRPLKILSSLCTFSEH